MTEIQQDEIRVELITIDLLSKRTQRNEQNLINQMLWNFNIINWFGFIALPWKIIKNLLSRECPSKVYFCVSGSNLNEIFCIKFT